MSSASLFSKLPQLSDFIFLSLSLAAMEPHEAPLQQQQQAPNLPPPRLIISEMVLENFKSYAGEQRVGPFHKVCVFSLIAFACLLFKKKKKKNGFAIWREECDKQRACFWWIDPTRG